MTELRRAGLVQIPPELEGLVSRELVDPDGMSDGAESDDSESEEEEGEGREEEALDPYAQFQLQERARRLEAQEERRRTHEKTRAQDRALQQLRARQRSVRVDALLIKSFQARPSSSKRPHAQPAKSLLQSYAGAHAHAPPVPALLLYARGGAGGLPAVPLPSFYVPQFCRPRVQ